MSAIVERARWPLLAVLLGCFGGPGEGPAGDVTPSPGVVVVAVEPGYTAARAGLVAGDRLNAWSRSGSDGATGPAGGERGRLASAADLRRVEVELGALGPVTVHGFRDARLLAVELAGSEWRLTVRPESDGGVPVDGEPGEAGASSTVIWTAVERAEALLQSERYVAAHEVLMNALARAPTAGAGRAFVLERAAVASYRQTKSDAAEREASEALALWRTVAPHAPGVARCQILLGKIARNRSQFDAATEYLDRALEAAEANDPGGPLTALALAERANVGDYRGDLANAEADLARALALYDALGVTDSSTGMAAMTHGILSFRRGDFDLAEERMRRALEIFRSEAPEGVLVAWALNGLGLLARERGDYERAADLLRGSLAIRERLTPGSLDVAVSRENLGLVAASRGDFATAATELGRAVALYEAAQLDSSYLARILVERADVLRDAGDLEAAAADLERALEMQSRLVPGSLEHAEGLFALGEFENQRQHLARARDLHLRALAIRTRLAPASLDEARSLHALGALARAEGRRAEALDLLSRAAAAIEAQQERVGGDHEDRSLFAARVAPLYKDLIELAVEADEVERAFLALERYHAQALRSLVASRVLALDRELPAPLARRRRELARAYEQERSDLGRLGLGTDAAEIDRRLARLRELAADRRDLEREVAAVAPRLATLRPVVPESLAVARGGIERGTLVFAFSVHATRTYRFTWSGDETGPDVESIPLGTAELARRVETIRDLATSPTAPPGARRALAARSLALGEALLGSAADRIVSAERVVVLPDGPLLVLPFAALRLADASGAERYLIELAPLSVAPSLAVRTALAQAGATPSDPSRLVAFGAPRPSAEEPYRRPGGRGELPGGEREIEALSRSFPGARTYVGAAATEERVKSEVGQAARLHFACHARVDDRFPLDSYIVLAAPRGVGSSENGLLAAWEIFEQLRTGAELVVLSACETGLGTERAGEGLVGLTSAFQYAGARAVLSSLWTVSDRSTAVLMERFYAYLSDGLPADEALRAAQLGLQRAPIEVAPGLGSDSGRWWVSGLVRLWQGADTEPPLDARHPFHWAAFQLYGDWR